MDDRELLELAAKAVGLKYHSYIDHEFIGQGINIGDLDSPIWNPLTDDGDAFRLASTCGLTVEFGNNMVQYPVEGLGEGTDPLKATRQAIVLAAAEIGKAMP